MVVVGSVPWCSPLLWGTAVTKVDHFWVLWYCVFVLMEKEFWFWLFFLVEHFLLVFL